MILIWAKVEILARFAKMEIIETKRYFLHLAYNGTNYSGWQIQANNETIQEVLKNGLEKILQVPINLIGCGRTDAGVHASQYYAHFDIQRDLPDKFLMKINAVLPAAIAIYDIIEVHPEAHARYDAISRSYQYFIHLRKDPFKRLYSFEFPHHSLDFEKIREATNLLMQYSEFKPLVKMDKDQPKFNCTIQSIGWTQIDPFQWRFDISANRFLYNMIRRIVGTMVLIGRDQLSIAEMVEVMDAQSEFKIIKLAPANGLHLSKVIYPFIK
jgi:tRNA pseudouridine38-40 synthase